MLRSYPSLRVAYIDEVEETTKDRSNENDSNGGDGSNEINSSSERRSKKNSKVYYSTLVKAVPKSTDSSEPVPNLDQVKLISVFASTV